MKTRNKLNREELESRYIFDLDKGQITYRINIRSIKIGDVAGTKRADGYIRVRMNQKYYFAHRLIHFIATGQEVDYIDHIDGNKSNNSIVNLRAATNSENMSNHQSRVIQGVYLRCGKWHGRVMKDYKTYRIKGTANKEEAKKRLQYLRNELHGEFAVKC